MHVLTLSSSSVQTLDSNLNWNWNWVLQFVVTALVLGLGFLHLIRSTASKYFVVDANFNTSSSPSSSFSPSSSSMVGAANAVAGSCAVCGKPTSKLCSRCKAVKYCSQTCQSAHWKSEHKKKCKEVQLSGGMKLLQRPGFGKQSMSIALVPSSGSDQIQKLVDKVLFPYDEFVKLFNWDKPMFRPCGLLNCGNSCFANVVLQCLAHTRPLLSYLLDKGHRRDCKRNEWCFLCELQTHMERASRCQQPFSPINILSRLPSIGANLGYGKQEDAHEFMRFAIDAMQSVCLDEHGGEKVIHPKSQETTLIQLIFGGQLQSQVICTQCKQISNQYENMMDLTVEIQGAASSLEDCLDQFTAKEWLHGENMYKCDGCNAYVRACKRLTIHQAPNILTVALKRFQSGRFGKINKKITFPESLDLGPYMSEERDGTDKYKLYAVVVHVDMLNASFFGHYICYTKGSQGDWYRIDDCKVMRVELDEVLSQGAYMLLYHRVSARPTCLKNFEPATKPQQEANKTAAFIAEHSCPGHLASSSNSSKRPNSGCSSDHLLSDNGHQLAHTRIQKGPLSGVDHEPVHRGPEDSQTVDCVSGLPVSDEVIGKRDHASNGVAAGFKGVQGRVFSFPSCSSEQLFGKVRDSTGSSASGVNSCSNVSFKASAAVTASMSDEGTSGSNTSNGFPDINGKLEEDSFQNKARLASNAENIGAVKGDQKGVALLDQTVGNNGSVGDFSRGDCNYLEVVDLIVGKEERAAATADEMEVDHVELLSGCDRRSNGCAAFPDEMEVDGNGIEIGKSFY